MMEFFSGVLAFFAGFMFTWYFFVACICGCMWCEHEDSSFFAVVFALLIGWIGYILFNLTWASAWPFVVGYIPAGFIWSFWRWQRHTSTVASDFEKAVAKHKEDVSLGIGGSSDYRSGNVGLSKASAEREIDPTQHIDAIAYWICMWPFSFLEQFVGDVIDGIKRIIREIADWTYARISRKAAARIDAIEIPVDANKSDRY